MKRIMSAAATPFTEENELDLDSAERLYEFCIARGIDGFFMFGTMGEWALMTAGEKRCAAEHACGIIGNRAAVILGIQDTGLKAILKNMDALKDLPHDAWSVVLPGGWAGPSSPVEYVRGIADASDRPLYFYHNPSYNGINLEASCFRSILSHPGVKGIKNSSDSIRARKELLLLKKTEAFELFEGQEWAVDESLRLGCDGAICGSGSFSIKILKNIASRVDAADLEEAAILQEKLIEIFKIVYGERREHVWSGQKHALVSMGIFSSSHTRVDGRDAPAGAVESIERCVEENRGLLF